MVIKFWTSGEEDSQCILPEQPYLPWMCCQYHSFLSLWLVLCFLDNLQGYTAPGFVLSEMLVIMFCMCAYLVFDDCGMMICRGTACLGSRRYE